MNDDERPQIEQELAERLGRGWFAMNGFDVLSIVYMISAEATQAAIKAVYDRGGKVSSEDSQYITEAVTDAINEWMNVQKDFILSFDTGELPPARAVRQAAEDSLFPEPEYDDDLEEGIK